MKRSSKHLSRREFFSVSLQKGLSACVATSAAGLISSSVFSACSDSDSTKTKAIVIGSGFGGAIAAYRLAKAGIETIVLERGKRWPITPAGDTFPTFNKPDQRAAWLSTQTVFPDAPVASFKPYVGLIERIEADGISVITGAGVGGSSLVFGGMMLQPTRELFERVFPREINYDELVREYYPRVKKKIGIAPIPDDVLAADPYLSTRLFLDHAMRAGMNAQKISDAVNWDIVREELAGRVVASATVGEAIYGMNSGAKNSVDHNYLLDAEDSGHVQVYPLHVVESISSSKDGIFEVVCSQIDEEGSVILNKTFQCEHLFLGAGSMGTTRLLVRARDSGALPLLNDEVGKNWGNNGDRLFLRFGLAEQTLPAQGGPASVAIFDFTNPDGPVTLEHGPGPIGYECNCMAVLGMGIPKASGQFTYDRDMDQVTLHWPSTADQSVVTAIKSSLNRLDQAAGGSILDLSGAKPFTYHPLGGVVLGKACDFYGRVKGYKGLYAVDASLIPGSAACCNPAWTVAALAERCMDEIVRDI